MCAANTGDTAALKRLLDNDPSLSRAEYWYQHPMHYAVRGGHREAARVLLDAGADPEANGLHDGSLVSMARDRGLEAVAQMLEDECKKRGRVPRNNAHSPIHYFAKRGEIGNVRAYLDADPL